MAALRKLLRFLVVGLWCSVGYASNVNVATQYGDVQGFNSVGIDAWLGVRYAAPAIGNLRWRPPRAPTNWTEPYVANTHFSCFQTDKEPDALMGTEADCLTMDIWAPANRDPAIKLPVMVWIHGGAFTAAAPNFYAYNGTNLVLQSITENTPVIVVAITYRLGGLGFMAYNKLAAEAGSMSSSGNYGILDQIFALKYIQNNIGNFGGDRSKVTIWGESAGGYAVCTLLASQLATGLFKGAIMESSYCGLVWYTNNVSSLAGDECVESNGCAQAQDTVACLRQLPVETAFNCTMINVKDTKTPGVYPNIDGYVLKEPPLMAIRSDPAVPQVPVMVGSNLNEYNIFALKNYLRGTSVIPFYLPESFLQPFLGGLFKNLPYRASTNPSLSALSAVNDSQSNEFTATMAPLYSGPEFDNIRSEFNILVEYFCTSAPGSCNATAAAIAGYAFATDYFYTITALAIDQAVTANGRDSYRYLFKQNVSNMYNTTYGSGSSFSHLGAYHNLDIPFVFGNWEQYMQGYMKAADPGLITDNEEKLSRRMQKYWLNFATFSNPNEAPNPLPDPNNPNLPQWLKTPNANVNQYLELVQPGISMGSGFHDAQVERLLQAATNPDLNNVTAPNTTAAATNATAANTTTAAATTVVATTPSSSVNNVANVFVAVIASIVVALF